MNRLRIAIPTQLFGEDLRKSIRMAAESRADAVCFDARTEVRPVAFSLTARRQLLHYLKELDLGVASLRLPTRRSFYDQNDLDRRLQATRDAMELARELKAAVLTIRPGRVPPDTESSEFDILAEVLNDLARHANQVGTLLAVTPSGDSADTLAGLFSRIHAGPIGLDFDPASFILAGHAPSGAFQTLHEHVLHIRARDAIGDMDGGGVEVALGRGEVEWDELIALVDEAAFNGWLTVDRTGGDDRAGDASRAIQYLRTVAMG